MALNLRESEKLQEGRCRRNEGFIRSEINSDVAAATAEVADRCACGGRGVKKLREEIPD